MRNLIEKDNAAYMLIDTTFIEDLMKQTTFQINVLAAGQNGREIQQIERICGEFPFVNRIRSFHDPQKAVEYCESTPVDVAILDTAQSQSDGISLARQIHEIDEDIHIVFMSDCKKYALSAFDVCAIDYHLKPIDSQKLARSLNRAQEYDRRIFLKAAGDFLKHSDWVPFSRYGSFHSLQEHGRRAAAYAELLVKKGLELSMLSREQNQYRECAKHIYEAVCLHDIGKTPFYKLINKKSRTKSERFAMIQHTILGYWHYVPPTTRKQSQSRRMLIADVALHHHEHWDGSGYPQNMQDIHIPLGARICGICSDYDHFTADERLGPEDAARKLEQGSGKKYDPYLTGIFLEHILPALPDTVF